MPTLKMALLHFMVRTDGDGVLCSEDYSGGLTDATKVTCTRCRKSLIRLAREWTPHGVPPSGKLGAQLTADGTAMWAPLLMGASDVCRILGLRRHRMKPAAAGGYIVELDSNAQRAVALVMREAPRRVKP